MVSPSGCTFSKSEGEITQILDSGCSREHWLCTKPHKISLNSAVSGAHRYWNRLQLLLSYRRFVKTKSSHSTTTFHMLALPLGWESQICTAGAGVFGMVWLVLSQWEPAHWISSASLINQCLGTWTDLCDPSASLQNFLCTRKDYQALQSPTGDFSSLFLVLLVSLLTTLELILNAGLVFHKSVIEL